MKRIIILLLITFLSTPLFAVDYSEMSTQELIAIMGYVEKKNVRKFRKELKSRVPTMSQRERSKYKKNLKKMNK